MSSLTKEEKYHRQQTPKDLAKLLIAKVPLEPGDVVWEPFRGEGNIFNQLPDFVHKDWSEIRDGRNYIDYRKPVDWVITWPPTHKDLHDVPFNTQKSCFFETVDFLFSINLVRKGIAILAPKECYMSFTPKRLDYLKRVRGFVMEKQVICNLKHIRGRHVFMMFVHDRSVIMPEPRFDYIMGAYPLKDDDSL